MFNRGKQSRNTSLQSKQEKHISTLLFQEFSPLLDNGTALIQHKHTSNSKPTLPAEHGVCKGWRSESIQISLLPSLQLLTHGLQERWARAISSNMAPLGQDTQKFQDIPKLTMTS